MIKKTGLLLLFVSAILTTNVNAQCRGFVRSVCMPEMEQYIPNENLNTARLMPGDKAEVKLTLYSGQDYRLVVCNHPILEAVEYQVVDTDGSVLYDNRENEMSNKFDFRVSGTRQLLVRLNIPEGEYDHKIKPQGCVAVMLGVKDVVAFSN